MDGTMVGDQVGLQGDMDRGEVDVMCGRFGHSARWCANRNLNGNPFMYVKLRKRERERNLGYWGTV